MTNQKKETKENLKDLVFKTQKSTITQIYLTKNKFEIKDGIIYIELTSNKGKPKGITMVSERHKDKVLNTTWRLSTFGYVVGYINKEKEILHRFITNAPKNKHVDHINHKKYDNRDENLRICDNKENCRNREKQHGVTFNKEKNKWLARIHVDYKDIFLGYYDTYDEALKARKDAEPKYFGEFGGGKVE